MIHGNWKRKDKFMILVLKSFSLNIFVAALFKKIKLILFKWNKKEKICQNIL